MVTWRVRSRALPIYCISELYLGSKYTISIYIYTCSLFPTRICVFETQIARQKWDATKWKAHAFCHGSGLDTSWAPLSAKPFLHSRTSWYIILYVWQQHPDCAHNRGVAARHINWSHVYIQERSKHEINGQRMVCSAMAPVLTAHASWKKVEKIIYLPLISVLGCNVPKTIVQFEDTLLSCAWTNRVECMLAGPSLMLALLSSLMLALNDPPSNIVAQQLGPLKHACRSVEWQLKLVADEFSEVNLIYKSIMNFQTLHAAVLAIVINALEVLPVVDLRSETL